MERRNVLSPEEIARVDASYQPIDGFEAWASIRFEESLWNEYATRLRDQRDRMGDRGLDRAVRGAMRAAAFDSGAIEGLYPPDRGFTITAAFQAAAWEVGLHERGAVTEQLVTGQLRGYELALDAATTRLPISEAWIRRLHEEVCAGQQTYTVHTAVGPQQQDLPRGAYKTSSNHVVLAGGRFHAYAPPSDVPAEMHRLVLEMSSTSFDTAHPVLQAAYAHHALTQIHPFADGNGRVARILASVFLFRAQSIPLVVFVDQRDDYLQALQRADEGDRQPFVTFLLDRAVDTLDLLANLLAADTQQAVDQLASFYRVAEGVTQQHLEEAIAALINGPMREEVQKHLSLLPSGVTGSVGWGSTLQEADVPTGYRIASAASTVMYVTIQSAAPYQAQVNLRLRPFLALERTASMPVMYDEASTRSTLRARVSDLVPSVGEGLMARMRAWVQALMAQALETLVAEAGK